MFDNLKDLKDKAEDLAGDHGDVIKSGLEKAGDLVDDKTGNKYSQHIDTGVDKAQDIVEELGKNAN